MLGIQIGGNIWADGVPGIGLTGLTYGNVVYPKPIDLLHGFEIKQSASAKNFWVLSHCGPLQWVSLCLLHASQVSAKWRDHMTVLWLHMDGNQCEQCNKANLCTLINVQCVKG